MKKVEREKVSWECERPGPRNIPGRAQVSPTPVCVGRPAALCLLVRGAFTAVARRMFAGNTEWSRPGGRGEDGAKRSGVPLHH